MVTDPIRKYFEADAERERLQVGMFVSLPGIVRALRGDLSQAAFAKKLGISREVVVRMENGTVGSIGRPVLRSLMEIEVSE
jgi:hypothetical protein